MLSNAAHRAGQKDLDDRASAQLIKLSDGSPEYHLFVGKSHLNLDRYDAALAEFQAAAAADPKLPFVHFNMGLTYMKKQDYPKARDEFLQDAAIEPDLALNYDELGNVYWLMQEDRNAEKSYREALRRNPRLVNSHLGLARIYQRQDKYSAALAEIDAAGKLDPARTDVHYMRGQVLLHLGRKQEAKKGAGRRGPRRYRTQNRTRKTRWNRALPRAITGAPVIHSRDVEMLPLTFRSSATPTARCRPGRRYRS